MIEIDRLDLLEKHVEKDDFPRVCLYLLRCVFPSLFFRVSLAALPSLTPSPNKRYSVPLTHFSLTGPQLEWTGAMPRLSRSFSREQHAYCHFSLALSSQLGAFPCSHISRTSSHTHSPSLVTPHHGCVTMFPSPRTRTSSAQLSSNSPAHSHGLSHALFSFLTVPGTPKRLLCCLFLSLLTHTAHSPDLSSVLFHNCVPYAP